MLGLAGREKKNALVYVWNPSVSECQKLWQETLSAAVENERLGRFVCFSANTEQDEGARIAEGFHIAELPAVLVVNARGSVEDAIFGYVPRYEFDARIDLVLAGEATVSVLRRLSAFQPKDLALRYALGAKLAHVRDTSTAEVVFASIRNDDPEAKTLGGAQLELWDLEHRIAENAKDANDPKTYDLSSMRAFLERSDRPEVLFEGWDWIARIEHGSGHGARAQAAILKAAPHLPEARHADWPGAVSRMFWAIGAELGEEQRTFVLELVEEHYGSTFEELRALDDPLDAPAGELAQKVQQLTSLARGRFLAGKKDDAMAALDLALKIEPLDPALQTLRREMKES